MKLTISEVLIKIHTIDGLIDWLDETWEDASDEDEIYKLNNARLLLNEYRELILNTEIKL